MNAASLTHRTRRASRRSAGKHRQRSHRAALRPAWRGCAGLSRHTAADCRTGLIARLGDGLGRVIAAFRASKADGLDGVIF